MKQELEYILILRDGIKYEIDLRDKNRIQHYDCKNYEYNIIDIWVNHKEILINHNMIISIEKK